MKIVFERSNYSLNSLNGLQMQHPQFSKLFTFILDWQQNKDTFQFQTSGSTGAPKSIDVSRDQIVASVDATTEYLGLKKSETALLCLDPNFVASLMMAARCLVNDMDLIIEKPSSNPLKTLTQSVDFASFVPMQIYKMIEDGNIHELADINNTLIGGAPLSAAAFDVLTQIKTNIYVTYGMSTTLRHIALMPVKETYQNAYFEVLPGIEIGQDNEGCLNITGTVTNNQKLQTNDIVELIWSDKFRWLGRRDHVINSGGIKIHPEQLEKVIETHLKGEFIISWKANDELGSECLLLTEGFTLSNDQFQEIQKEIETTFSKYHIPKSSLAVDKFERTDSGKIKREETRLKALGLM